MPREPARWTEPILPATCKWPAMRRDVWLHVNALGAAGAAMVLKHFGP